MLGLFGGFRAAVNLARAAHELTLGRNRVDPRAKLNCVGTDLERLGTLGRLFDRCTTIRLPLSGSSLFL